MVIYTARNVYTAARYYVKNVIDLHNVNYVTVKSDFSLLLLLFVSWFCFRIGAVRLCCLTQYHWRYLIRSDHHSIFDRLTALSRVEKWMQSTIITFDDQTVIRYCFHGLLFIFFVFETVFVCLFSSKSRWALAIVVFVFQWMIAHLAECGNTRFNGISER